MIDEHTLIMTAGGLKTPSFLTNQTKLITADNWGLVDGVSLHNAPSVRLTLKSGHSLVCSPDTVVMTQDDEARVGDLTGREEISLSYTQDVQWGDCNKEKRDLAFAMGWLEYTARAAQANYSRDEIIHYFGGLFSARGGAYHSSAALIVYTSATNNHHMLQVMLAALGVHSNYYEKGTIKQLKFTAEAAYRLAELLEPFPDARARVHDVLKNIPPATLRRQREYSFMDKIEDAGTGRLYKPSLKRMKFYSANGIIVKG